MYSILALVMDEITNSEIMEIISNGNWKYPKLCHWSLEHFGNELTIYHGSVTEMPFDDHSSDRNILLRINSIYWTKTKE